MASHSSQPMSPPLLPLQTNQLLLRLTCQRRRKRRKSKILWGTFKRGLSYRKRILIKSGWHTYSTLIRPRKARSRVSRASRPQKSVVPRQQTLGHPMTPTNTQTKSVAKAANYKREAQLSKTWVHAETLCQKANGLSVESFKSPTFPWYSHVKTTVHCLIPNYPLKLRINIWK